MTDGTYFALTALGSAIGVIGGVTVISTAHQLYRWWLRRKRDTKNPKGK